MLQPDFYCNNLTIAPVKRIFSSMDKHGLPPRYAVLDLGTNTLKLLIADRIGSIWKTIYEKAYLCRLGENLQLTGLLSETAKQRTLNMVEEAIQLCHEFKTEEMFSIGTAAFRQAQNGEEFREILHLKTGLDFEILTGEDEAKLTLSAMIHEFPASAINSLVVDIGGGSTEIVRMENGILHFCHSLPWGCVTMLEACFKTDPPTNEDLECVSKLLQPLLKAFPKADIPQFCLVLGGTAVTLGSLAIGEWNLSRIHGLTIPIEQIETIAHEMLQQTIVQRSDIPGMVAGREDVMPSGLLILTEIMHYFEAPVCVIGTTGIRHGLLYERVK
jgi:exopolyphosphatase/guanosine-5'-triphosphate,3'-diphosphate pyrophosphatase